MSNTERTAGEGLLRGLLGHCPQCGEGRLFGGYLKVDPRCEACGHDLAQYRADDGPAYFTILIVGHLVIAPLLCFSFIWTWTPLAAIALTFAIITAATLTLLPRIKGAFIGVQWATRAPAAP